MIAFISQHLSYSLQYIDPNYTGGGYDEYFGEGAPGVLDCHSPETEWQLLGVYRQEFYQYIEQISKHVWGYNDYQYIVALAGLSYMGDEDCQGVGYDESGNYIYAAVQPLAGGNFQMGLYSDAQCIVPNTQTDYSYDDFVESDDAVSEYADYTLTTLNTIYDDFKFCTSCVDYPTYQDGYFIGDDGTDEDDIINQCWKFYSHDSYNCDADCIAMGAAQNSITWINYGGKNFGALIDGQDESGRDAGSLYSSTSTGNSGAYKMDRLKANLFMTLAGTLLIATFLAFVVARGSTRKKIRKMSSKSRRRRLLDEDYGDTRPQGRSRRQLASVSKARTSFQKASIPDEAKPSKAKTSPRGHVSGKAKSVRGSRSKYSRSSASKIDKSLQSHQPTKKGSSSSKYRAPALD